MISEHKVVQHKARTTAGVAVDVHENWKPSSTVALSLVKRTRTYPDVALKVWVRDKPDSRPRGSRSMQLMSLHWNKDTKSFLFSVENELTVTSICEAPWGASIQEQFALLEYLAEGPEPSWNEPFTALRMPHEPSHPLHGKLGDCHEHLTCYQSCCLHCSTRQPWYFHQTTPHVSSDAWSLWTWQSKVCKPKAQVRVLIQTPVHLEHKFGTHR